MNKRIRSVCVTAAFTALLCVLSPLTVPMPIGVPFTLQTPLIALTAFLLGAKAGTAATAAYILLGFCGLPVFSGFGAGVSAAVSPTGGFIFAFPFFALVLSFVFYVNNRAARVLLGTAALILLYAAGASWFVIVTKTGAAAIIAFIPYFIKDTVALFAAYFLSGRIRPAVIDCIHPSR
ncbi:MAG: biotin transporter BioY [Clostridia bacterium]|nr:biotin transporter BioY [Clostridia bacterium]